MRCPPFERRSIADAARLPGRSSDWPHDFEAAGHQGLVSSPFKDVAMAISSVVRAAAPFASAFQASKKEAAVQWYISDTSPEKGGTWLVPYSHLDPRNPRNPDEKIHEFLPIPGELQVRAPPGSVLMQDSRTCECRPLSARIV